MKVRKLRKLAVFVGTRPEIIKMAAIVKEAPTYFDLSFVHTGQHYDWEMSSSFIKELKLPDPDLYLKAKPGPNQFPRIIEQADRFMRKSRPDIVLVEGDTNSAAAAAIAACKLRIPVGHIEAGCRSFDPNMQEEINRTLIADCARLHFAATQRGVENLEREGVAPERIFLTGHPVVRTIREMVQRAKIPGLLDGVELAPRNFAFLTAHREENVDNRSRLADILASLSHIDIPIVFPIHPRTRRRLRQFRLWNRMKSSRIIPAFPMCFVEALGLVRSAFVVFSDSGGIQQEAALLGTPCITLRDRTEWMETVDGGVNFLAPDSKAVHTAFKYIERNYARVMNRFTRLHDIFGGNEAPSKILAICRKFSQYDGNR